MSKTANTLTTGFAMFAMFFGAGNIVFPLEIGKYAQNQNFYAILGLLITAVGVPFLGLTAMTVFDGNYKSFFERIGKVPGFIVSACIMALIGPFGATPRCITLSHSTMKLFFPSVDLFLFSLVACLIIFAFTIKKNSLLDVLGYYLTPFLLGSLGIIVVKGLWQGPTLPIADVTGSAIFMEGLVEGYKTMDLMGAFFFSSVVLSCLRKDVNPAEKGGYKELISKTLKASCLGASLLAITYVGFSYLSASFSSELVSIPSDQLISAIATQVLGEYAGLIVSFAVAMACFTTAMALVAICAEFIHIDISRNHISYPVSLVITLVTTLFISTLSFTGIMHFLIPVLQVCYPALIVLSICNLLHKVCKFDWVKAPVFTVFGLSLANHLWSHL